MELIGLYCPTSDGVVFAKYIFTIFYLYFKTAMGTTMTGSHFKLLWSLDWFMLLSQKWGVRIRGEVIDISQHPCSVQFSLGMTCSSCTLKDCAISACKCSGVFIVTGAPLLCFLHPLKHSWSLPFHQCLHQHLEHLQVSFSSAEPLKLRAISI